MTIKVYRGAASANTSVWVSDGTIRAHANVEEIAVRFATGGPLKASAWRISIDSTDFAELAAAMVKADAERASKAFEQALAGAIQS
ncbi:hypothetical protein [Mesorhizobium sp. M7A.F.Ca.US.008.03.1.1]|uniref:hypothetical protein n=1 Tax=Mesorhizobium sp. M7A.F.Ca.US.008.03.1.1 TaxID=2496742 RepID=UPI000FCBF9A9|nr:hypothetical protein [Mesorhizobium sp. M7A.F.Ca.US.008.03.1.1]RUW60377.1 hypothetical protein EOA16_18090 [Mesorhizobium sp. M7A.F.Ca.US.008.03.1.1]